MVASPRNDIPLNNPSHVATRTDHGLLPIRHPDATNASRTGAKAANLAMVAAAGLPIQDGVVITTEMVDSLRSIPTSGGGSARDLGDSTAAPALAGIWAQITENGSRAVVVRSSSPNEDGATQSLAGHFTSVLNIKSLHEFLDAVAAVSNSAAGDAMAVLIQHQVDAATSGILFGVDPLGAHGTDLVVSAVAGTPDDLVSGRVDGTNYVLTRHGRIRSRDAGAALLTLRQARNLARTAGHLATRFGSPQDVEWAIDQDGQLWVLQTRPITATAEQPKPVGPVLGAGPIAETFPGPLSRLEADLWVDPMAQGLKTAMKLTGAATPRRLDESPVVTTVAGGWVVADLELLGIAAPTRSRLIRLIDVRPAVRSLASAWRVGRLRAMLPDMARHAIRTADQALATVPHPTDLSEHELLATLLTARRSLHALHGQEATAGLLTDGSAAVQANAISAAYRAIAAGRRRGHDDAEILATEPAVLALFPPTIHAAPRQLPEALPPTAHGDVDYDDAIGTLREALRLRIRWTHELMAVCARELGDRLNHSGRLAPTSEVADLCLEQLSELVLDPHDMPVSPDPTSPSGLIPVMFRRDDAGNPIPHRSPDSQQHAVGAGGGRGEGRVWQVQDGPPPTGRVLVAAHLEPGLAAYLPEAAGLITETGNVLSHLAIVAREMGVPTVVRVPNARSRFATGALVAVDGDSGTVTVDIRQEKPS